MRRGVVSVTRAPVRGWLLVASAVTGLFVATPGAMAQADDSAPVADTPAPAPSSSPPIVAENAGSIATGDAASAWLPPLRPSQTPRIQHRRYTKAVRGHVAIGAEYLARGDFHISPGATATGSWFFNEYWAVELGVSRYLAFLNPLATDVRERTGYVPDSRAPHWLFRTGARLSAGYGKVLILGQVMHFEPQFFARASLLLADGFPGPGGEVGMGLHVHLSRELHLRFDLSAFPHAEKRSDWTPVFGVAPSLSIGFGVP